MNLQPNEFLHIDTDRQGRTRFQIIGFTGWPWHEDKSYTIQYILDDIDKFVEIEDPYIQIYVLNVLTTMNDALVEFKHKNFGVMPCIHLFGLRG